MKIRAMKQLRDTVNLILCLLVLMNGSIAQVQLNPSGPVVSPLTGQVRLTCSPSFIPESLQWLVNGTHLEELNLTNVQIRNVASIEIMNISNITEGFNITTIQCVATSDSGDGSHHSNTVILLVQGLISAEIDPTLIISNYFTISLTWTAPFSLDITYIDPDITYCVGVIDSTSMSTLHSQCGLIDTAFNYSITSSGVCGDYTFTITPVNAVGNGTSATIQYSQALSAPGLSEQRLLPLSSMDGVYTFQMNLSSLVCESELTFEDVDTGEERGLGGSDLIISNTIMFTTAQLNTNRLYSVSVSASNPSGSALSNTRISTHDIQNITISDGPSSVVITVDYVGNTEAVGALVMLLFISNNNINFSQSVFLVLDRIGPAGHISFNISTNTYTVLTYDIEQDGLLQPHENYPATRDNITLGGSIITGPLESPQSSDVSCSTLHDDLHVSVMCDCKNRNTTGYQVLLQYNSLNDIHRLLVGSGTCVPVSSVEFDVGSSGDYHVTVFPVHGEKGVVGSKVAFSQELEVTKPISPLSITTGLPSITATSLVWIIAAAVSVFSVILCVLVSTCLVMCWHHRAKKSKANDPKATPKLDSTSVYEEIGDSPDAFKYTQCSVYGLLPDKLDSTPVYEEIGDLPDAFRYTQCSVYGLSPDNNIH